MEKLDKYLSGKELYGDNFNIKQIREWFKDEEEGFSGVYTKYKNKNYVYHELNKIHGYSKVDPEIKLNNVVSFGGANGEELLPILNRINKITIIEPSEKLRVESLGGKKITYITPVFSGKIKLKSNSQDMVTCLGTLHHIPNVSFVFGELVRVLKKGGFLLIREPIVSMGNWNIPREGLTRRERGIPPNIFKGLIKKEGLEIISERKIMFPLMNILNRLNKNNKSIGKSSILLDSLLSAMFSWNYKYHARAFIHKFQPLSIFYVLKKKNE